MQRMRNQTANFPGIQSRGSSSGNIALPPVTLALASRRPASTGFACRSNLPEGSVRLPAMLGHCTAFQHTFPTYRRLATRCSSVVGSSLIISTGTNKENDRT
jgi:hypothetical protein